MLHFRKTVPGLNQTSLSRFAARAARAAGLRGETGILITSSAEMKHMNRWFRHIDSATDVLSFPTPDLPDYAGDLAISADIAAANARRLKHSVADEVKVLILHGILHLAGFDHESDEGEMAAREARLRKRLGLPPSLTERQKKPREAKPVARAKRPSRPRKAKIATGARS